MPRCFSPTSELIWVMSELWANDDRSSYDPKHPASTPYRRKEAVVSGEKRQQRIGAGQVGE
jgi:hypothetical protein